MFRNQYDTDVTTWSPQGRLFQVEYALESVKSGSACVGVVSGTHAVVAALKRAPSDLARHQQKVFRIDDHVGIAMSGIIADGRSLTKYMRQECLGHKYVYESPLQVERLVVDVADKHQKATQSYVRRPYGVGLLVAGFDRTGPHLYQTSPSGDFYDWRAYAIGARSQSARTYLEKHFEGYKTLSREDLIREALRALHMCVEGDKELTPDNTSIGVVGDGERFHVIEGDAVAPFLAGLAAVPRSGGAAPTAEGMEVEGADAPAPGDAPGGAPGEAAAQGQGLRMDIA